MMGIPWIFIGVVMVLLGLALLNPHFSNFFFAKIFTESVYPSWWPRRAESYPKANKFAHVWIPGMLIVVGIGIVIAGLEELL